MIGTFETMAVMLFGVLMCLGGDIAVEKIMPRVADRGDRLQTAASWLARGVVLVPVLFWPFNSMLVGSLAFVFVLGYVGMLLVNMMNSFH